MKLQDLKIEDFDFETEEKNETEFSEYTDYAGGSYKVISRIAYLIGVEKKIFEHDHEPPKMDIYNVLKNNKNARIIRNLCRLRNAIETLC